MNGNYLFCWVKTCFKNVLFSFCFRYIAIIHPIKAHILCNRRRIVGVLGCLWPFAWISGLPTLFFNTVRQVSPGMTNSGLKFCMILFPDNPGLYHIVFKFIEAIIYYFVPLTIQLTLYFFISRHLFLGSDRLHRPYTVRDRNGMSMERYSEAIQARKGVVKMLIASVLVYFLSYLPNQILLILNLAEPKPFQDNWSFLVFSMIVGYVNSAANPILYSIFSQNFRECFRDILCRKCCRKKPDRRALRTASALHTNPIVRHWRHTSLISAVTDL